MPAYIADKYGNYRCGYCGKVHKSYVTALACFNGHHVYYVPISQEDLVKLLYLLSTVEDVPKNFVMKLLELRGKND